MFGRKRKALEAKVAALEAQLTSVQNEAIPLSQMESWGDVLTQIASKAGPVVNSDTAMRASAVYACVGLISGAVAGLPLHIYSCGDGDSRERVPRHPVAKVLNRQPSPAYSAAVFWEYMLTNELLRGDQFAVIERNRNGDPLALHPANSSRVVVMRSESDKRRLVYGVQDDGGEYHGVDQDDMIHVPGVGFNGLRSMSRISYAGQQSIGLALAAEEFSARFFGNRANPDVVIEADGRVDEDVIKLIRQQWQERYSGLENSHLPLVLTQGLKASPVSVNADDAQLIESRKFQTVDIARIFGVPPFMIGELDKTSSWGSGVEQMGLGFVRYTLQPYLNRIEQELNRKLFRAGNYVCEFDVAQLLRGDTKARSEYYRAALGGSSGPGWMTINEVRGRDNLPRIAGGEKLINSFGSQPEEPSDEE